MTFQNAPAASTPDDRATEFQAVQGGETFSGEKLVVEAYLAIWLILMVWIGLLWRKQQSLTMRLDGLEAAIDRATAAKAGKSDSKNGGKKVTV